MGGNYRGRCDLNTIIIFKKTFLTIRTVPRQNDMASRGVRSIFENESLTSYSLEAEPEMGILLQEIH